MFDLTGKKALVTGSSQGIGKAIAKCFSDYGAYVFIHGSKSIEKCEIVSSEIGGVTTPVVCDLEEEGCADSLFKMTGNLDILVLNASVQIRKPWEEITEEEFMRHINVNLKSSLRLMQKYAPHMKKQGWGRIVSIGSVQQYKPHKDMLAYAATKEAQMSYIKNLAKQLGSFGITANNIAPGVIETPRNEEALADEKYRDKILKAIPLGYAGEAVDIAGVALLLCSDAGRYVTGCDVIVDGGMHL